MDKEDTLPIDTTLARFYGDEFYEKQVGASLTSAMAYAALLAPLFRPASVVDLGCGRGTWLKAFKDIGASKLVGYDGNWNTQRNMIDPSIVFRSANLNEPICTAECGTIRFGHVARSSRTSRTIVCQNIHPVIN